MADWYDQKITAQDIADNAVEDIALIDGLQGLLGNLVLQAGETKGVHKLLRPSLFMKSADDGDQTSTFTIQIIDGGGTALAEQNVVHVWTSGRGGATLGTAVAIAGTFAPTTGVIMSTLTAKGDFLILSDTNGTIVMDSDDSQAGDTHCMASIGGRTYTILGEADA